MDEKTWEWTRTINSQEFLISSSRELLPVPFVQEAFAKDTMYWAKSLSSSATITMLNNSLTLGIYITNTANNDKTPIGMARMVTDYTTLAYLTDVYLQDSYRDLGIGKWIIRCCRSIVLEMPDLRFMVLLTGSEQAQKLYKRELGMGLLDGKETELTCMGARREKLADAETSNAQEQGQSI